ncbi:hypothetical protein FNF31_07238 [Cafeteria roenbergensis]|uniref:FERM domain-containing protein n=2 Tax=Cafeteria roenbergensis TaxID=33653 RepID=A0A5A8C8X4_CAFRO|nr:hypothetical protein FNF31_07238 [Cafeteria roenbergensis]
MQSPSAAGPHKADERVHALFQLGFHGDGLSGWQEQSPSSGDSTVQAIFRRALLDVLGPARVSGEAPVCRAASRLDAGSVVRVKTYSYYLRVGRHASAQTAAVGSGAFFCRAAAAPPVTGAGRPAGAGRRRQMSLRRIDGKVCIVVHLLDNSSRQLLVEDASTVHDVLTDLAVKQNIKPFPGMNNVFGLCEARDGVNMGMCLPIGTPIVPIVSSWLANKVSDTAKFVFKIRLFANVVRAPEDKSLCYMSFIQGVYEVITGILPVTADEAISLAALQMQVKFGNSKPTVHTKGFLSRSGQLKGMVPAPLLLRRAMSAWDEDILARHRLLNADARANPMRLYCRMLLSRDFYGAEYFSAGQSFSSAMPESVVLAVGLSGVHVLTLEDKRILDHYSFAEINRWGFTSDPTFYVDLKAQMSRPDAQSTIKPTAEAGNRFTFTTKHGRDASDLLTAYATRILEEINARRDAGGAAAAAASSGAAGGAGAAGSGRAAAAAIAPDEAATRIQAMVRGARVREDLQREAAAVRIQALMRGNLARMEFDRMLEEAEAEFDE